MNIDPSYSRILAPACAMMMLAATAVMVPADAAERAAAQQSSGVSQESKKADDRKAESKSESRSADRKSTTSGSADGGGDAASGDQGKGETSKDELPGISEAAKKQAPPAPKPASPPSTGTSSNGIMPSTYTGSYYRAAYEPFRKCIVHRESRGDYSIRNPRSSASGAYQFLLSTSNEVARMMNRPDLVGRSAGTWSRYEQDQAFYTLFDHGRGISHWGGSCG